VCFKLSKSCFEGLKAGAQISALKPTLKIEGWFEGFGPSNSRFLDPQIGFEGYQFEGTASDALRV
jgi:hypothetical protein